MKPAARNQRISIPARPVRFQRHGIVAFEYLLVMTIVGLALVVGLSAVESESTIEVDDSMSGKAFDHDFDLNDTNLGDTSARTSVQTAQVDAEAQMDTTRPPSSPAGSPFLTANFFLSALVQEIVESPPSASAASDNQFTLDATFSPEDSPGNPALQAQLDFSVTEFRFASDPTESASVDLLLPPEANFAWGFTVHPVSDTLEITGRRGAFQDSDLTIAGLAITDIRDLSLTFPVGLDTPLSMVFGLRTTINQDAQAEAVPEPGTLLLSVLGLA